MKKLNEKELVEVKGGLSNVNLPVYQNLIAMRNVVNKSKHSVIYYWYKKIFG